ncbi:hypothetical protein GQ44DRAFT_613477, partial [Phaeosphaeriaceae sp. PMI808]
MDHLFVPLLLYKIGVAYICSKLSQAIGSQLGSIKVESEIIKAGVEDIKKGQDLQKHHRIMDWLSSADFPAQQSDFIARRQEDTGLWFLNSSEFTEWVNGTNQTLFCPGIPGAGKTMMAAITVDHLQKNEQTPNVGVVYIYCNYQRQADQSTSILLAAMLKQLVQDRPSIAEPVSILYDKHRPRATRPTLEEMLSTLRTVLANYSRVYVVVDALDECLQQDRRQLLKTLRDLQSNASLCLMATARFIPDIVEEFTEMPKLEVRAGDADVKRYVVGQIGRLPRCIQRDDNLQVLIQDKIVEAVDGMFLLARLHVDLLLDKGTKKKVITALEHLSGGTLKQAYDEAIKRIEGQLFEETAQAKKVLSWITYAQRPLTTDELCHALAVELGDEELDEDNIPDVEDIISVCAGLVTVDEESNVIRLVHYTTQDYLKGIQEEWILNSQCEIASICLTYLCFNTFRSGPCMDTDKLDSRCEENLFLRYSAQYWGDHAATVQENVRGLAMGLLCNDKLAVCAFEARSGDFSFYNRNRYFKTTGLHLVAFLGLLQLSEALLATMKAKESPVNSKDGIQNMPLHYAVQNGHMEVVKLLLEHGAEVDSKGSEGRTPLSWAAEEGYEAVVKLLLEHGAEVDSKDNNSRTPLSWAAKGGYEVVVKLLLEDGVEVDTKDNYSRTPLSWAAKGGYEAVVKLLLEHGAEADTKDKSGRTPLFWAALYRKEAVVKLLLE